MNGFLGEVIGTMLLILLGNGGVANVLLAKTKGNNSGWIVITTGWALGVFTGAFVSASASGAHINPVVSIALAITRGISWVQVPVYIIAQIIGAFLGATLVWIMYLPHWPETKNAGYKLAIFCSVPAIRNYTTNLIGEIICTFVLVFGIFCIKGVTFASAGSTVNVSMGTLGVIPVAFLVWAIGLSLGGPTGYAMNPARDLGPRIAHFILPIAGKGDSDWKYSCIPVVGPIIGAIIAAVLYLIIKDFGFK